MVSGAPVAGATVALDGRTPVTTGGDGSWAVEGSGTPVSTRLTTTVTATGFVTRETAIAWRSGGRQDVAIDLLPERTPFSMAYYREFVRNGFEAPANLQPLRRWTTNPNFYVNTFNPKTGRPLEPGEIALVVQSIRDAVPQVTGGFLAAGSIETGDGPRGAARDWINLSFIYDPQGEFCGQAFVGANPGTITLNYDRCAVTCGSMKVQPETIAHEVGHAMGFWHTGGPSSGIMNPTRSRRCSSVQFSEEERLHARVAYSRTGGNLDPDRDPASFSAMTDGSADAPRVTCTLGRN